KNLKTNQGNIFKINACECLQFVWLVNWVKAYSNIPVDPQCLVPPGDYYIKDVVLPTQMPFHVDLNNFKVDLRAKLKSNELLYHFSMIIKYLDHKNKAQGG
ncbi:hypothetical protein JYU34_016552, partial [Plutella xylostella]